MNKKLVATILVAAAAVTVTGAGIAYMMTDSKPSESAMLPRPDDSSETSDAGFDDTMEDLETQFQDRRANAGEDAYYQTLGNVFDVPRSEMDSVLRVAPQVCHYYANGEQKLAAAMVMPFANRFPSEMTRDIQAGREENILNQKPAELLQQDADAWAYNTFMDYCPSIGY